MKKYYRKERNEEQGSAPGILGLVTPAIFAGVNSLSATTALAAFTLCRRTLIVRRRLVKEVQVQGKNVPVDTSNELPANEQHVTGMHVMQFVGGFEVFDDFGCDLCILLSKFSGGQESLDSLPFT